MGAGLERGMRVAILERETFYTDGNGSDRRLHLIADLIAGRGHSVIFYCTQWWDGENREKIHNKVKYCAVTDDREDPEWKFIAQLPSKIKEFNPDLMLVDGTDYALTIASKMISSVQRKPLMADFYKGVEMKISGKWKYKFVLNLPDLIVVPSELVLTNLVESGCKIGLIRQIPSPIDIEKIENIKPMQWQKDRKEVKNIVYSRFLDEDANIESLFLGLAQIRDVEWNAVVIGDGKLKSEYERQAKDFRISDRVKFLGEIPIEEKIAIFKGAHICVHTATKSASPKDFLLALACGCVGIAEYHTNSSAHEFIKFKNRGFRTTESDKLHLVIRQAMELPKKEIEEGYFSFGNERFTETYINFIQDLIGK